MDERNVGDMHAELSLPLSLEEYPATTHQLFDIDSKKKKNIISMEAPAPVIYLIPVVQKHCMKTDVILSVTSFKRAVIDTRVV